MRPAGLNQILAFFYRPQGRISRTEYALGVAFIYSVNLSVLALLLSRPDTMQAVMPLAIILAIPLTIAFAIIMVKRCHDLGLPGSFVLLLFVPLAGVVWLVALLFIPGSATPNLYGAPPALPSD